VRSAPARGAPAETEAFAASAITRCPSADIPTFIVHGLPHVRAALAAAADYGAQIRLLFPFSFAAALGPEVAREVVVRARAEMPGHCFEWVLDCADEPGLALSALRAGIGVVRFDAGEPAADRLADIARQLGARIDPRRMEPRALDLANLRDPLRACRKWLANGAAGAGVAADATLPTPGGRCI